MTDPRLQAVVREEVASYMEGFEDRLARGIQKGMDLVKHEMDERLRQIEEDLASILRHIGQG